MSRRGRGGVVVPVDQHWPALPAGVGQTAVDRATVVDEGGACRDTGGEGGGGGTETLGQTDLKMGAREKLSGTILQVHVHQGDEDCEARLTVVLVKYLISGVWKTEEKLEVTALDSREVGLNQRQPKLFCLCQYPLVFI